MEEKIYQDIRTNFENKYINNIVPKLSPFEEDRKKTLNKTIITIIIMVILSIIFLLLSIKWNFMKFGGVLIFFAIVVYPIAKKNFENKLKKLIMPYVCGCFPDLKWIENVDEITRNANMYISTGLFSDFDNAFFDDYFIGKYNGVNFEIREFEATKEIGYGKDKRTETIFDGVIVHLDMNKNFTGNTVLRPHGLNINTMTIKWQKTLNSNEEAKVYKSPKLHKTTLEDVEFNKKFDVYTNDEVEARYLLTTSLMERLNTMQTAFNANKVAGSFYEGKFYIALYTNKDLFSIGSLNKNVCDKEQFNTMFEEILSIIKLIDHFKLNQKIGL